jgi:phosphatidate cytidylyltransferase
VLRYRLILGPILVVLVLAGLWLDEYLDRVPVGSGLGRLAHDGTLPPAIIVLVACLALSALAAQELARILIDNGITASRRVLTVAAVLGLAVAAFVPVSAPGTVGAAIVASACTAALLTSLAFHSRHRTVEGAVAAAGGTLLAFTYLGLMFGFIVAIRREHSAWVLLWVILATKSCDIGAFFAGRAFGRHKLIPWLSPGKTWEGLAGGAVLAAVVGAGGLVLVSDSDRPTSTIVGLGLIAGVVFALVGQAGDLIESLFKRDAGIKDSGRSVPGFGGVLDVLDSLLLVAPVAYWLLRAV